MTLDFTEERKRLDYFSICRGFTLKQSGAIAYVVNNRDIASNLVKKHKRRRTRMKIYVSSEIKDINNLKFAHESLGYYGHDPMTKNSQKVFQKLKENKNVIFS